MVPVGVSVAVVTVTTEARSTLGVPGCPLRKYSSANPSAFARTL